MAPPQTRSLSSRKRACSTDEPFQTHDVQAAPLRKDTEGDIKEAGDNLLQSDLQHSAAVPDIQREEPFSLSKPDDSNLENNSEGTDATDMGNKEKEETTVYDPNHCFELETCGEQAPDCTNGKETRSEACCRSPRQPQMFVPASEGDSEPCQAVLEKQAVEEEGSNLKRNQDSNNDDPSFCMSGVKESAAGLPAKKKRRMGMCGLTEKERSHFLLVRQHGSAQNGAGSAEKPKSDKTSEPLAVEEDVSPTHLQSTPPHISADVIEEREEEPRPPHGGDDYRAEADVHSAVTGSDGTRTTSNPGCSEGRDSEAKEISLTDPELSGSTEPTQPAKEGEEKHLENLQPPEVKEATPSKMTQTPETQTRTGEDLSPKEQTNSLNTSCAKQQEESDADAAPPQTLCVDGTSDESKLEVTDVICDDGAEEGASSAATRSADLNCGSENVCEASLAPTVQEMNYSCDPNGDPAAGPSVVHTEGAPTRYPEESSGSECLDYVSDSQLNTIVLIEERKEEPDPSDCLEDATELICGLIRELSSLNRKVMVAHRELENLRRKPSRSSVR
ncbi:uncharacterized protein FYW61_002355 [Anableps anableps]